MDNLTKLIENGGWRPVAHMPIKNDGLQFLIKRPYGSPINDVVIQVSPFESRLYPDARDACRDWEDGIENATQWQPLDTLQRMAEVIKVLLEHIDAAIEDLKDDGGADAVAILEHAKVRANAIAGGEDE